jgi:nuclear GTP-binding protein
MLKANRSKAKPSDQAALSNLVKSANLRAMQFDSSSHAMDGSKFMMTDSVEAAASGRKDNSKKAYYREFKKVVETADVILEVLDARDPIGCRPKQIEEMIVNSGINKRIILVLNKIGMYLFVQKYKIGFLF